MKQSKLLLPTYRDAPRDADVVSQQLMMRGGMIQKVAAGIYDYLPLALRSIRKFENIVREELARDGAQELLMPTVQPAELWQESGRWQFYGRELLRLKDRKGADFCLGPTHEEVVTDIVRKIVKSYKQLPINLFQVQTKFRDEIRPRFGLMRGREFIMKDGYSFHVDDADADREYWRMFEAYKRIFTRLGVKFRPVEADSGAIGGSFTHEFHVLAGSGEDAILSCTACEYTSNAEKTEAPAIPYAYPSEPVLDLKKAHFHTPGIVQMEEQAKAFRDAEHNGLPLDHASKFYLYRATKGGETWDVGLVLRSDHEPNTVKMKNLIGADSLDLVPLEEAERRAGTKSGFIGPVEFDLPVYADKSLEGAYNLTCGANKEGYHHFGFKPDRDLMQFKGFHDLRLAKDGDACPRCGKGDVRGVPRHRSGSGLQARHEVLSIDELRVPGRVRHRAPDGDGLLWDRHHADDRCRAGAELRCRRCHLAVAGRAVSGASRQPRFGEARDRRGRQSDRNGPRRLRIRSPARRSRRAEPRRQVQGRRSARHAVATDGWRERTEGRRGGTAGSPDERSPENET